MARFWFNYDGYEFHARIEALKRGYEIAAQTMDNLLDEAAMAIADYDRRAEAGELETFEADDLDEEGRVILYHRQRLEHTSILEERQLYDLRKAYALMLFHEWERSARKWTKDTTGPFFRLVKKVQDIGYPVDPDLVDLYVLANTLKHDSQIWKVCLANLAPRFLTPLPELEDQWGFERAFISFKDREMQELFRIVAASGPQSRELGFTHEAYWRDYVDNEEPF